MYGGEERYVLRLRQLAYAIFRFEMGMRDEEKDFDVPPQALGRRGQHEKLFLHSLSINIKKKTTGMWYSIGVHISILIRKGSVSCGKDGYACDRYAECSDPGASLR